MNIKSGHISNPLTIIGIFAGLAEIGGTVVLPMLSGSNQFIFMWYVMFFPVLLVLLFFCLLFFYREALYAPKDYENENHFVEVLLKDTKNNTTKDAKLKVNKTTEVISFNNNINNNNEK